MKELQDNINAVIFTPNSKMGKMLMAKCKTLQEENEEIGNQASEGKVCFFIPSFNILHTHIHHLTSMFKWKKICLVARSL